MSNYERFYINGSWIAARDELKRVQVINPYTEEPLGTVALAEADEVDLAVEAAHSALPKWSSLSPDKRAGYLHAIADTIEKRTEEIGDLLTREVGVPTDFAKAVQVGWSVQYFRDAADAALTYDFESPFGDTAVLRKHPVGVVAAITPWNFPLMQSAAKIAPALAAGCTVVLKPSQVTPLSLFLLGDIATEVGLPDGVLNIVVGDGPVAGEHMVKHPKVNAVSFTGSTRAGTRIAALAAADVKRVTLELGGKSAAILTPDGDLEAAVRATVVDCYANSGQKCVAHTRLLVPRELLASAERAAAQAASELTLGDPSDPATAIGPLVSAQQRDRVHEHIQGAVDAGLRVIHGGAGVPEAHSQGYFVKPTIFSPVPADADIAQEEIFGPVLSIIAYDSVEEAIEIANDSEYGLGGGVWAGSREEAFDIARRIQTGQVSLNGAKPSATLPFGGFKKSGIGREGGEHGLEEFLETQTIF